MCRWFDSTPATKDFPYETPIHTDWRFCFLDRKSSAPVHFRGQYILASDSQSTKLSNRPESCLNVFQRSDGVHFMSTGVLLQRSITVAEGGYLRQVRGHESINTPEGLILLYVPQFV